MRLSICYQLLVPLLTLMVGVVGMSTWTALASAQRARAQLEKQMLDVGTTVGSRTFLRTLPILRLMKGMSGADFLLCDSHGQPLQDDQQQPLTTLVGLPQDLPAPAPDWRNEPLSQSVAVANQSYFCLGVPVGQDVEANLIVYILYPESLWRDALWQAIRPALIFGVLGSLLSILLWVVVAARLTRRIQQMEERTRHIAAGDFSPMPLPVRNDELRDLSRSINDMAQQLAQYEETVAKTERLRLLGQVSGGLAHQLRNGVAGAKLAVQLYLRETAAASAESLQVALRQLVLVESHLKRFLDLGKALELHLQSCDLSQVVTEALALVGPQCRHSQIDLQGAQVNGPLPLQADPGQLSQLFLNLLTNAIDAAGPGGWVRIHLESEKNTRAIVEVTDSGPGPPAALAGRLFEPFVTGKSEGVGLGLAVARQVAEAHGGSLQWRRGTEGTCFRVELPMART